MSAPATPYMRPGFHAITPYLILPGAETFLTFAKNAFGAKELLRVPDQNGKLVHAELRIGDSTVEFADSTEQFPPRPAAIHLYVPDVDSVYNQAVQSGATTLRAVTDQPYGDREGSVGDAFGNHWYIATHTAGKPGQYVPEGLRSVTPYLHVRRADAAIDFYRRAFDAELLSRYEGPDGRVMHAELRIADSVLELGEAHGEWQPIASGIQLYVPDVDSCYAHAVSAGATAIFAPEDKHYGERMAGIRDPFGNDWFVARFLGSDANP